MSRRAAALAALILTASGSTFWSFLGRSAVHLDPTRIGFITPACTAVACGVALNCDIRPSRRARTTEAVLTAALLISVSAFPALSRPFDLLTCLVTMAAGLVVLAGAQLAVQGLTDWLTTLVRILIASTFLAMTLIGSWVSERDPASSQLTAGVALLVSGALMSGALFPYYRRDFVRAIEIEEAYPDPAGRPQAVQEEKVLRTRRAISFAVAGIGAILWLTVSSAPSLGFEPGIARWSVGLAYGLSMATAALLSVAALAIRRWSPTTALVLVAVAAAVWSAGSIRAITESRGPTHWLWLIALVLAACWTCEGLLANPGALQVRELPTGSVALAGAVAIAAAGGQFWVVTRGLYLGSHPTTYSWSLLCLLCVFVTGGLLSTAAGLALYSSGSDADTTRIRRTVNPPTYNLIQDLCLMELMFAALVWLPALTLAHVPAHAPERWSGIGTLLGGFLLFLSPVYFWTLKNNTRHAAFESRVRLGTPAGPPAHQLLPAGFATKVSTHAQRVARWTPLVPANEDEWVETLDGHIALQNLIAMALAALSLIGVVGYANDLYEE